MGTRVAPVSRVARAMEGPVNHIVQDSKRCRAEVIRRRTVYGVELTNALRSARVDGRIRPLGGKARPDKLPCELQSPMAFSTSLVLRTPRCVWQFASPLSLPL